VKKIHVQLILSIKLFIKIKKLMPKQIIKSKGIKPTKVKKLGIKKN